MKFSIVSNFYNETPELVNDCCNSVLSQTYGNFEWIITEDFSQNEELVKLVKSLPERDKRIKFVQQQFKKEIYWNHQKYATGDIVMVLDGDDFTLPKTLEIYNHFYTKYPDVFCMTTELANYKNGNKNYWGSIYINYENYNTHLDHVFDNKNNPKIERQGTNTLFSHGYNRSWRNIPGLDFKGNLDNKLVSIDFIQLTRLEEMGKLLHLPRVLYGYNTRDDSQSRKKDDWNDMDINTNDLNNIILDRRKGRDMNTIKRVFDQIFIESNAFFGSSLNYETTNQNILLITPEILSPLKKEQLKELFFDHTIYFNDYSKENIDYCFLQLNSPDQYDEFIKIYENYDKYVSKVKEFIVQITYKKISQAEYSLAEKIRGFLSQRHGISWFDFDNYYITIKVY